MNIQFDPYDRELDWEAVKRIWLEIGWMRDESESECALLRTELELGSAWVARLNGNVECVANGAEASLQYLDSELPISAVTAVATGNVARKRGLASRLTARLIADMTAGGAALSMLGIFDQGYYDQLGFGTGSYDHRVALHPRELRVAVPERAPCRLTSADWEEMHDCRMSRRMQHGYVTFCSPNATRCETFRSDRFGFGFRDEQSGELTHFFWCQAEDLQQGPYNILSMSYDSNQQFLDLMGVLKSLGDQVHLATLIEPPDVQLQDLVSRPFARLASSSKGKFATGIRSFAMWQARICNLTACLQQTHLNCKPLRFNLHLSDPIAEFLDSDQPWRGVAGKYLVTLGPDSSIETGTSSDLPTLTASVNAFTRLWLGVRPASGLAATDQLDGPPALLSDLDHALQLPKPAWEWRF